MQLNPKWLERTWFIDSDNEAVMRFADQAAGDAQIRAKAYPNSLGEFSRKGSYCRGGDRAASSILRVPFWHFVL